jgi:hypothetical protein
VGALLASVSRRWRTHSVISHTYVQQMSPAQKTTGWQDYNQDMKCMMRVGVKPDGTVVGFDFIGQMVTCQAFMP